MADDDLFAQQVIDLDIPSTQTPRLMTEWTPEMEMLTNLYDRMGEQITVALAAAGVKNPAKVKPAPRPKTAMDRMRQKRRVDDAAFLRSKLIPTHTPAAADAG